ncbi:glycosyltransferase family 2 protein [Candidatus Parcubacteria bacterium]|nr:MAG: glycosyltransferase family 2 protein [Candidatus Parcubacteria bacterium]
MEEIAQGIAYGVLFWVVYSGVLFLIVLLEGEKEAPPPPLRAARRAQRGSLTPFVSIIIPAYNEERTVAATIASALALKYPPRRREIIVVDDGSTDNTARIARRWADEHPSEVFLIRKKNGGKYTALNEALKWARGSYIVTLDADSQPDPEALMHLVAAMEACPQAGAATPAMVVRSPRTLLQHMQSAEYAVSTALRRAYAFLDAQYVTPGPFSIFRRSALKDVGMYRHAHNTEDLEMALRLQLHGWRILNVPQARVSTATPPTLSSLLRQRVRWSYGFLRNVLDYRDLLSPRYGHLGAFVLPNMLVGFFGVVYAVGFFVWNLSRFVLETAIQWFYAGWHFDASHFFDWFFLPLNASWSIALLSLLLALVLLERGKALSRADITPWGYVSYLILYGFLAPLWIVRTLWRAAVVRAPTSWQSERQTP